MNALILLFASWLSFWQIASGADAGARKIDTFSGNAALQWADARRQQLGSSIAKGLADVERALGVAAPTQVQTAAVRAGEACGDASRDGKRTKRPRARVQAGTR